MIDVIVFPLAYLSALFVGWSLREFKSDKDQVNLEIQLNIMKALLEKTKTSLQAELDEAKAEVEALKLKIARIHVAMTEPESEDEMPELVDLAE